MNFCSQCGMKLEPNYQVCPNCGKSLVNTVPGQAAFIPAKRSKAKDVVSMVLNCLGLYFCFVLSVSKDELILENLDVYNENRVAFCVGLCLWQIAFSSIALGLTCSSRKKEKTNLNLINLVFSLIIYGITIIQFIFFVSR